MRITIRQRQLSRICAWTVRCTRDAEHGGWHHWGTVKLLWVDAMAAAFEHIREHEEEGRQMTRKDYILLARVLNTAYRRHTTQPEQQAVLNVASELAAALRWDNPRFDTGRFMLAVTESKGI